MGHFDHVTPEPPDPIFGINNAYNADAREKKVNLTVGAFKTPQLETPILASVKKSEEHLFETEKNKEYLPIEGDKKYLEEVGKLIFGEKYAPAKVAAVQTIGGTGALRLGVDFLKTQVGDEIYYSNPTWANHLAIMKRAQMKDGYYPYYNTKDHVVDFEAMVQFFKTLKAGSIVLLHACCHNPTGADLSQEQWKQLCALFVSQNLIPFFDFAYQGFGKGVEEDAYAIRLFAESGLEMLVSNSFSKNFGLYGERVGGLFIVAKSEKTAANVLSKLKVIVRTNYSNPPLHGAKIVSYILSTPQLKKEWLEELETMRKRIIQVRGELVDALEAKAKKRSFAFLKNSSGLFCYCGLDKQQTQRLMNEYGIYMTGDGRINVVGINDQNLKFVVDAILSVSDQ